jgi:RNA:NAD 2'-phosphotransferase (TPT1/KptA family)
MQGQRQHQQGVTSTNSSNRGIGSDGGGDSVSTGGSTQQMIVCLAATFARSRCLGVLVLTCPAGVMKEASIALSWLLRHSEMPTRSDGYVPVQEVLDSVTMRRHRLTVRDLQKIVSTNDKQRFEMEEEESPPLWDLLSIDSRNGYSHSQSEL